MRYSLLFVFLVVAGCGGPERVPLRGGTEHLPLLHRRTLKYQERDGADTKRYTVRMHYSGGHRVRVYELEVRGLDLGSCRFLSDTSRVHFETNKPSTAFQDVPEFRQLWVDETAETGDFWEDEDTGTRTAVAPRETVTVPAGTFADCYKTVTTGTEALLDSLAVWRERNEVSEDAYKRLVAAAQTPVIRWFAAGVGLVKEQIGGPEHVRELLAVTEEGTGRADVGPTEEE